MKLGIQVFLQLVLVLYVGSANADALYGTIAAVDSYERWYTVTTPIQALDEHRSDGIYTAQAEIDPGVNYAKASVDLKNGTIKMIANSGNPGDYYPSLTDAHGSWMDTIYFDFDGEVTLRFEYDATFAPGSSSFNASVTTQPAFYVYPGFYHKIEVNQYVDLPAGTFYAYGEETFLVSQNTAYIIGNEYQVRAYYGISFNAWNTASLSLSMPEGGSFTSASGVLLSEAGDPVPEPATMILFGTGLAGLVGAARRRKKTC